MLQPLPQLLLRKQGCRPISGLNGVQGGFRLGVNHGGQQGCCRWWSCGREARHPSGSCRHGGRRGSPFSACGFWSHSRKWGRPDWRRPNIPRLVRSSLHGSAQKTTVVLPVLRLTPALLGGTGLLPPCRGPSGLPLHTGPLARALGWERGFEGSQPAVTATPAPSLGFAGGQASLARFPGKLGVYGFPAAPCPSYRAAPLIPLIGAGRRVVQPCGIRILPGGGGRMGLAPLAHSRGNGCPPAGPTAARVPCRACPRDEPGYR